MMREEALMVMLIVVRDDPVIGAGVQFRSQSGVVWLIN